MKAIRSSERSANFQFTRHHMLEANRSNRCENLRSQLYPLQASNGWCKPFTNIVVALLVTKFAHWLVISDFDFLSRIEIFVTQLALPRLCVV
jgi:hypothetical protein